MSLKGKIPIPIPRPLQDRFAKLIAEIISQKYRLKLSRPEVTLIGQNGKVALPSLDELKRIQRDKSPIYSLLLIDPQPTP